MRSQARRPIAWIATRYRGAPCGLSGGLRKFRARWYDPVSGRWLSKDPLNDWIFSASSVSGLLYNEPGPLLAASVGPAHMFVHNNPVNRVDPLGLKDRPWPFNGRVKVDADCREGEGS